MADVLVEDREEDGFGSLFEDRERYPHGRNRVCGCFSNFQIHPWRSLRVPGGRATKAAMKFGKERVKLVTGLP